MAKTANSERAWARAVAAAALSACAGAAWAVTLQTVEPRPFGYTVGDVLERRVQVDAATEGALDPASLPRPGRYGRWFQLRQAVPLPDGARLLYQVVNTPEQADQENLPSLNLRLVGPDGRSRDAEVGPFTVTMMPVVHMGANETVQPADLRPDLDPQPIETSRRRARVLAYAGALLALAALQLAPALARRFGWRRAGSFSLARRALRQGALRADDPAARLQALRRLHRALDEAAGVTLALDNVEALFRAQPWLAPARPQIETMLAQSRAAFFGQTPAPPRAQLWALATQLAALERQR